MKDFDWMRLHPQLLRHYPSPREILLLSYSQVLELTKISKNAWLNFTFLHDCLFYLSSGHMKATVALYFRRILIRLGVACFQVFRFLLWFFFPVNLLLLFRSHQAEIIIIKRLIEGCNNVTDEGGNWTWITRSWTHGRRKNGALTLSVTLPPWSWLKLKVFMLNFNKEERRRRVLVFDLHLVRLTSFNQTEAELFISCEECPL